MRTRKAFTLIEMLAVIGIMLVLMVATFGAFSLFAERMGPGEAQATLQGYLNGARAYAAANGVKTRVEFSVNIVRNATGVSGPSMQDGTVVTIEEEGLYKELPVWNLPGRIIVPSLGRAYDIMLLSRSNHERARLSLAIAAYRAEQGSPPPSLTALAPFQSKASFNSSSCWLITLRSFTPSLIFLP